MIVTVYLVHTQTSFFFFFFFFVSCTKKYNSNMLAANNNNNNNRALDPNYVGSAIDLNRLVKVGHIYFFSSILFYPNLQSMLLP